MAGGLTIDLGHPVKDVGGVSSVTFAAWGWGDARTRGISIRVGPVCSLRVGAAGEGLLQKVQDRDRRRVLVPVQVLLGSRCSSFIHLFIYLFLFIYFGRSAEDVCWISVHMRTSGGQSRNCRSGGGVQGRDPQHRTRLIVFSFDFNRGLKKKRTEQNRTECSERESSQIQTRLKCFLSPLFINKTGNPSPAEPRRNLPRSRPLPSTAAVGQ